MKYSTLLGPIPEISFVDNLVFTFAAFAIPGTATKSGTMAGHWDADWLPRFVLNTLNRAAVVFASLFSTSHARSKC